MDTVLHDVRYALRTLRKNRGFAAAAVLTLALGIGANTAIFSVLDAVVLQPLPYPDPDRLVSVWEKNPQRGWHQAQVAAANFLDWRQQSQVFEGMAAHADWVEEVTYSAPDGPVTLLANEVTGDFFSVLGVAPALGAGFSPEHDWSPSEPVAVLSHGFWLDRFGGDDRIIGARLTLDGIPTTVVGVMPASFRPPRDRHNPFPPPDLWLPMRWDPASRDRVSFRRAHGLTVIGRLRAAATLEAASAEIETLMARLEERYPETNTGMGGGVTPLHEWVVGDDARRPLYVLMAAVALVLLVAAANVANMLLARAGSRRDEMAVRTAVGAGRGRLVGQVLAESLVLATLGGALGLLAGYWGTSTLIALGPGELPRLNEVGLDLRVVGYGLAVTGLTGIAFGLVPALRASSTAPAAALQQSSRRGGRRGRRLTQSLVVAEVAVAVVLLAGAGLLGRSFWRLSRVDPGFDPERALVVGVSLPSARYPNADAPEVAAFFLRLQDELGSLPGVTAASGGSRLPFVEQRWSSDFTAEGWPADRHGMNVRHEEVLPGFFETMGIPLIEGRTFDGGDRGGNETVVVINRALADRYFPDNSPVGTRITFDRVASASSTWRTIVGVVADVRREGLGVAEAPTFYAPLAQDSPRSLYMIVRTEGDPLRLAGAVRAKVLELDPNLPAHTLTRLEDVVSESLARERFLLVLLGCFAAIAVGLAAIGVYGVIAYATSRRTHELGIRMALGAHAGDVLRLVIRHGMLPVAAGIGLGLAGAVATTRLLDSLLYEVSPTDPLTLGAVTALLAGVALCACALPARRATRLDPTTALRSD